MKITIKQIKKLERKNNGNWGFWWGFDEGLFGKNPEFAGDIYTFNVETYKFFLDNVKTVEDLRRGLGVLSPLADDALEVAKKMDKENFIEFKEGLLAERQGRHFRYFDKYSSLVIPSRFIMGQLIAKKLGTPLGCALLSIINHEIEERYGGFL